MHPEISQFPSDTFYEGLLKNHFSVEDRKSPIDVIEFPDRVNFIDMPKSPESNDFKSFLNKGEALETQKLVNHLCKFSSAPLSIGIISPYKA